MPRQAHSAPQPHRIDVHAEDPVQRFARNEEKTPTFVDGASHGMSFGRADAAHLEPLAAGTAPRDAYERSRELGELRGRSDGKRPDETVLTSSLAELSSRLRHELIIAGSREPLRLCNAIIELSELRDELLERRRDGCDAVQTALSRVRGTESVDAVLARGTAAVCEWCGFDRAMVSRVEDSRVAVQSVCIPRDPAFADEILTFSETIGPKLDHPVLETEMVRRRRPMLVLDAQNHPRVNRAFAALTRSTAYVAAPIMSEGHVIGCLHADLYYSAREPDEVDRDLLFAFAKGLGSAVGRATLRERLRREHSHVSHPVASTEALRGDDAQAKIEIVPDKERRGAAVTGADPSTLDSSQPTEPLTPREREVLELVAQGATNGVIGDRLVISAATVKSHVGHILRKLNAGNRAEAVSRYLRAS
jgi:LuxR family transcriptional regulator, regulator of acetate metabolism